MSESQRLTDEEFRERIKNRTDIEQLGTYVNSKTKIRFRCTCCGCEYDSYPNNVLKGYGCRICSYEKGAKKNRSTHEDFCNKLEKVSNGKITPIGQYFNNHTKIMVHCNYCGYEWSAVPSSLIAGHGCPKCCYIQYGAEQYKTFFESYKHLFIPISEYKGRNEKMKFRCMVCDAEWERTPSAMRRNIKCPNCESIKRQLQKESKLDQQKYKTKTPKIKYISESQKEQFENKLKSIRPALKVIEYFNNGKSVTVECDNKHKWQVVDKYKLLRLRKAENQCPYCSGLIKDIAGNSIGDVRPDLIKYFKYPEDAFKYFPRSEKNIILKCPICGKEKCSNPDTLYTHGFSCSICRDGISLPNKVLRAFILQNKNLLQDFDFEWSPDWAKPYYYDGYFKINDFEYVIEMHGQQHYSQGTWYTNKAYEKQVYRDNEKRRLAIINNIVEIEVPCLKSDIVYLTEQIRNSELSKIFNMESINWDDIYEVAFTPIVKVVADYHNEGRTIKEIMDLTKLCYKTVQKYIKLGNIIGVVA